MVNAKNQDFNNNKKLTIAIISWSVSHNPLGRAYMLAEALSSRYKVQLIGFVFDRYGRAIWEPVKNGPISIDSYPGNNFPGFAETLESVALNIEADIILVCKPRIPSLQLGLLMKAFQNRPLILDIDDDEISFMNEQKGHVLDELRVPYGETWTRFSETLIPYADHILVSNVSLQDKYGGTVIPHARDEKTFDPELYSKEERRKQLGISLEDKIVIFLGTPREHKGLAELLKAVKECKNPSYKLCIMGSFPDSKLKKQLQSIGGDQLILLPDQPFKDIAKNIVIADAVCLLQDIESEVSKYQLPAKAIDAIAMGIPILATKTPPIESLISQGLIMLTSLETISKDIDKVLSNSSSLHIEQLKKRPIFLEKYSHEAISDNIERVMKECLKYPKPLPIEALNFIDLQKKYLDDVSKLIKAEGERKENFISMLIEPGSQLDAINQERVKIERQYNAILQSRTLKYMLPIWNLIKRVKQFLRV